MSETTSRATGLAQRRLARDLESPEVQLGVARGWWSIKKRRWPFLYVVVATAPNTYSEGEVMLRIDVGGYPQAPTACPWNPEADAQLAADNRPAGGRAGVAFRADWEGGRALYLPVDRVALEGHPSWPSEHPATAWDPERGIGQLLALVHTILNEAVDAESVDAA
ncbi:MAG: DUF7665 family protein [Solirubrobacterales bacterium]